MLYSSLDNKKIKDIKKLSTKKYRDLMDKFIVEGEHLVSEAYKNGYLEEVLILEGYNFDIDVVTNYVTLNVLKYLSNLDSPCKVIGVCSKIIEKELGNRVLVLEDIQDPGNLGTIIRSSVAFNVDTIVLSNKTVDLYNSKVLRSCQGLIFSINIISKDIYKLLSEIKKEYKIYGTRVTDGKSVKEVKSNNKMVVIMGNEGNGISDQVIKYCDDFIYIDVNKKCESLNVAIACSIILYELDKQ